jgi:hypothetical protein
MSGTSLLFSLSFTLPPWSSDARSKENVVLSKEENCRIVDAGTTAPPRSETSQNCGIVNLLLIVLLLANVAHFDHFSYKGTFIDVAGIYNSLSEGWQSTVILFVSINIAIVAAFVLEIVALRHLLSERSIMLLQILNVTPQNPLFLFFFFRCFVFCNVFLFFCSRLWSSLCPPSQLFAQTSTLGWAFWPPSQCAAFS